MGQVDGEGTALAAGAVWPRVRVVTGDEDGAPPGDAGPSGDGRASATDGVDTDEGLDVLIEHALAGRGVEAEAYLDRLVERGVPVSGAHFSTVMGAYLFARRVDDVERVYRWLEVSPPDVSDDHVITRLRAWSMGERRLAWQWWQEVEGSGATLSPEVFAALVDAVGTTDFADELRALEVRASEEYRDDPDVAEAFVYALSGAGQLDDAERWLDDALWLIDDGDRRGAMARTHMAARLSAGERARVDTLWERLTRAGLDIEPFSYPSIYEEDPEGERPTDDEG